MKNGVNTGRSNIDKRKPYGYGAKKMMKEFPAKKRSRSALNSLIATTDSRGSAERKQCICTSRSHDNIAAVEELVPSQEDQPSTHRSTRQLARETDIAGTSVCRIIHTDLRLTCFKKKRTQELSEANKITRLVRAKQLLKKDLSRLEDSYGSLTRNYSPLLHQ